MLVQKRYWKRHPNPKTTSSKKITLLQEEIQNLQKDNNRLTETKDCKLKIIKTWSKYQIRRQDRSCGHYKKAPKTYKWVTFQSQSLLDPIKINRITPDLIKTPDTTFSSIYWSNKDKTWNSYKFHSNQNFTKVINQRRSTGINSSCLEMTDSVLKDEGILFQRTRFIWKLLDLSGYVHKNQRRIWRKEFKFRINNLKCCYKRFLIEKK